MTGRLGGLAASLAVPLLTVTGLLAVAAPAAATTSDSSSDRARVAAVATTISLDGVRVRLPAGGAQVVTVNHTSGYHARVSLWRRVGSTWKLRARSRDGRIGYGGLVVARLRRQASGTTPLGTFAVLWAFGRHDASPTWSLPYRRIARGDYWVEDNASAYYNRYRNKAEGGFRWWLPMSDPNSSERLGHFVTQYEYSVVIGFNYARPVRHRGAGIFFHVNGPGATAGCVSAPRWLLQRALNEIDPALRPVIAIGR